MRTYRRWCSVLALLCIIGLLTGCSGMSGASSLEQVYRPAYENCLEQLEVLFPEKRVNSSFVTVRHLKEEEETHVVMLEGEAEDYFAEHPEHHWVFLIGKSSGYEFVQIVCNSTTNEVIGYLTTE